VVISHFFLGKSWALGKQTDLGNSTKKRKPRQVPILFFFYSNIKAALFSAFTTKRSYFILLFCSIPFLVFLMA